MTSPSAPATVPLLHRFLLIGLVLIAAVSSFLNYRGIVPLLKSGEASPAIAYGLSGIAVVLLFVALLFLRPRVPERRSGQTVDDYWSTPDIVAKVTPVWFLIEGAGTLSAVAFLLTGELTAACVMGVAIITFFLCRPDVFAKE